MWLGRAESCSPPASGRQPQDWSRRRFPAAPAALLCLAAALLFQVSLSSGWGVGLSAGSRQAPLLPGAPCPLPWEGEDRARGQEGCCGLRLVSGEGGKAKVPVRR